MHGVNNRVKNKHNMPTYHGPVKGFKFPSTSHSPRCQSVYGHINETARNPPEQATYNLINDSHDMNSTTITHTKRTQRSKPLNIDLQSHKDKSCIFNGNPKEESQMFTLRKNGVFTRKRANNSKTTKRGSPELTFDVGELGHQRSLIAQQTSVLGDNPSRPIQSKLEDYSTCNDLHIELDSK